MTDPRIVEVSEDLVLRLNLRFVLDQGSSEGGEEPPLTYSVPEAARLLSISDHRVYELLDTGELTEVKIGQRRLVPRWALLELVQRSTVQGGSTAADAELRAVS